MRYSFSRRIQILKRKIECLPYPSHYVIAALATVFLVLSPELHAAAALKIEFTFQATAEADIGVPEIGGCMVILKNGEQKPFPVKDIVRAGAVATAIIQLSTGYRDVANVTLANTKRFHFSSIGPVTIEDDMFALRVQVIRISSLRFEPDPYSEVSEVQFWYNLSVDGTLGDFKTEPSPIMRKYTSPSFARTAEALVLFFMPIGKLPVQFGLQVSPDRFKIESAQFSSDSVAKSVVFEKHKLSDSYRNWRRTLLKTAAEELEKLNFTATVTVE